MTPDDVKIVADNIDDFIEVPDGLARLRKAVLTLAMSGKLVAQIVDEGTAEDLFKEIQCELKNKTEGRKKKASNFMPPSDEEIPFDVPTTWKWVRINEIGKVIGGGTPSTSKKEYFTEPANLGSIPWLSPADMRKQESMYVSHGRQNLTAEGYKNSSATLMPAGTIIFSSRAPIGYVGIAVNPVSTNQGFKSIVPATGICPEYVYWFLRFRADDINARAPGTTFKEISGVGFAKEVIALPPSLEQRRIADKVQEVMKQLDELETKKRERDDVRTRLARSAMQALGKGKSKIAFEQLTELVKTPSDIKVLENAFLTLAVSGKLVPQSKADGTAENLYNQIQKERTKVENSSTARKKKTKDLAPIADDEIPFEVPASWKWIRLGDCMSISSGDSLSVKDAKEGGYLVYGGNGIAGHHSAFNTKKGTIVIGRVGALCGIAHIVESDAWITDNAFIVDYPVELIDREYFALVLNYLNLRSTHRGSAQPVISGISVYPTPMPLAPLAEQKRIVKKVEEGMVLIKRLKQVVGVK